MTEPPPSRRLRPALVVIAALALALRALPLVRANGPVGTADYDEGVYVGAAALFTKGFLPYRDFGFLHPPGIVLLLAPLVWAGHAIGGYGLAFAASRWMVCFVGAFNVYLVGRLAARWLGILGSLTAAVLYATFFSAVLNEGRVELEPFLNAVCLTAALLWLRSSAPSRRVCLAVGATIGLAATIKIYGFVYIVPLLATASPPRAAANRRTVVATAATVWLAVVVPFAAIGAVGHTWNSIVRAQIERPGGGDVLGGDVQGWTQRAGQLFAFGPLGGHSLPSIVGTGLLIAMVAIAAVAFRSGDREGRFWALLLVSGVAVFLRSPSFFETYPVFVAPASCVLLAYAVERIASLLSDPRIASAVVAAALLVIVAVSVRTHVRNRYLLFDDLPDSGAHLEVALSGARCVYADPPYWALAADRLPDAASHAGLIDSFGEPFITAVEHGEHHATPAEARLAPAFQERLRAAIGACDAVVLGVEPATRADWTDETRTWFASRYVEVRTATDFEPAVFRERNGQPVAASLLNVSYAMRRFPSG